MSVMQESLERQEQLQGVGCSRKRKEDPALFKVRGSMSTM